MPQFCTANATSAPNNTIPQLTYTQSRTIGTAFAPASVGNVGVGFDLLGLADLAPDNPVTCVLHHADGSEDRFDLDHTMTEEQISWFRAGSALNKIKEMGR